MYLEELKDLKAKVLREKIEELKFKLSSTSYYANELLARAEKAEAMNAWFANFLNDNWRGDYLLDEEWLAKASQEYDKRAVKAIQSEAGEDV